MFQEEHQPQSGKKDTEHLRVTPRSERLPIFDYSAEIKERVRDNDVTVVVGETGSGKTTEIPLMLQEALGGEARVAITQPRRVAARSVARYVAGKAGVIIGEEVGYHVRFDDRTTEGTRLTFMTDGILLRTIQEDPTLGEYSAVMIDEAHERTLNIDFTLGLLKRMQKKRVESGLTPIKILVSSATMEKEKFAKYFAGAPVVEVEGRQYPVELHYEGSTPYDYIRAAAVKVKDIVEGGKEGDILVFLPGQEEIEGAIEQIEKFGLLDVVILPLYGAMSPDDQDRIFQVYGNRKIVVSTNVAESSVTVPGIKYVVDSGLIKQVEFDPQTGIQSLVTTQHAKSGCIQRTGRAGRISEGECHRLYDKKDFEERLDFQTPEIQRSNLANVVLTMKRMGIEDVKSFEFIDPPEPEAIDQAIATLKVLGALDDQENITKTGEVMADLPLEPHIGRMIIEAEIHQCVEVVCTLAAFMSTRSVFARPKDKQGLADIAHMKFKVSESDFLTLWKVWQAYEASNYDRDWARDNFLSSRVLEEVRDIRYQLFRALKRNGIRVSENNDPVAIGKSVASGLIENLMEYSYRHSYRRVKDGRQDFYIHPSSATFGFGPRYFVPGEIVETKKRYARTIQSVKPGWIKEIAPQLIKEEVRKVYYDSETDTVKKRILLTLKGSYGDLQVEEREASGKEAVEAFAAYLSGFYLNEAAGEEYFPFIGHNRKVIEQLNDLRMRSQGSFMKEDFTQEQLKNWYVERLGNIHSLKSLEEAIKESGVNLELDINEFLSDQERERILVENPDTIKISRGPSSAEDFTRGLIGVEEPSKEPYGGKPMTDLSVRRELSKLRIDNYWELTEQGVEELGKIVREEKVKDIGRWRLVVAALASKGLDGAEVLIQSDITETDTLDAVEKGMEKAITEARTNERIDTRKIMSTVDDSIKRVEIYKRLAAADRYKLVKDFLGNDEETRKKFRKLFYELMESKDKLPDTNSLGPDIDRVLGSMTS